MADKPNSDQGLDTKFQEDPRFKVSHREAIIGIVIAVANFMWWFAFAYGLGSKPVEEYTYILGLPAWFFFSCVLGFVVFSCIVFLAVKFFYKEVPLDDDQGGGLK
ncbi:putative membrane protein YhdT [Caldalkalibacillus uzonensis]|uniref:Membrane protein YhdT n=1 Tax=Caldalkalibacillus uzonensis TaxID=353224 RepID=A0ABU0CQL6_9BACI|nr:YhdT family protein [Caldalkalibacillus uzonensis]MDQ0338709.1 putative membrane protein YhdT [Caldalkalibacillus uzonensis]